MTPNEIAQQEIDRNYKICGLSKEDKRKVISSIRKVAQIAFEAGKSQSGEKTFIDPKQTSFV